MYDPETAAFIRSTPELEGLDRDTLPDQFSRAFAEIASARVALREGERDTDTLRATADFARRLARTNEVFVAVSPERENQAAAAYVAATSYQLVRQVEAVNSTEKLRAYVRADAISADISAMLLFLSADASADAAEIAQTVLVPRDARLQSELILSLIMLAQGQVGRITDRKRSAMSAVVTGEGSELAVSALYYHILRGVRALAFRLQGRKIKGMEDPVEVFNHVKNLAAQESTDDILGLNPDAVAVFPGPFHLASLLITTGRALLEGAVVDLPPPTNAPRGRWRNAMKKVAAHRPYLWRNHKEAVTCGYLEPGTSSVIGFPTGAGKSTVSQLKIHAVLLAGKTVVFLAPTNTLVEQTARDLNKAFPSAKVRGKRETDLGASDDDELPDILVMTPEACLLFSHLDKDAFSELGLLIFDECHLIHPKTDGSRRAIDAMLCILSIVRVAPDADLLLLSAMMKNTEEIAGWIADLTGRPALTLNNTWKPTRQLRGCVVYDLDRIRALEAKLLEAKRLERLKDKPAIGVPAALRRELIANPLGFFSVQQTWASKVRADYALVPLLPDALTFSTNNFWRLTPNAGQVSAALAARGAETGIRVLVFAPTIPMATSIAENTCKLLGPCEFDLIETERTMIETAIDELGGEDQLYFEMKDGKLTSAAACHHGQLLPEERRVVESLYQRGGAVSVLVATSTLAQGMNLPAELVILSSDSEYDADSGSRNIVKAEDLLNAAGRAGRAGKNATGMVLIVPGKVVGINDADNRIGQRWGKLREIFSQADQCLILDDPFTALMDRVHDATEDVGDLERYVVGRLAETAEGADGQKEVRFNLSKSFGAYRKRKMDDADWVESRTKAALNLLEELETETVEGVDVRDLAAQLGMPEEVLRRLAVDIGDQGPAREGNVEAWCEWLFDWLATHPEDLFRLLRQESFEYLFGTEFRKLANNSLRASYAIPKLKAALSSWMSGKPLKEIQTKLPGRAQEIKRSTGARKFVIRFVPDLAHLMTALAGAYELAGRNDDGTITAPFIATTLNTCVRLGFDSVEMVVFDAYFRTGGGRLARREVHRRFAEIKPHIKVVEGEQSAEMVELRVESAIEIELNNRDWSNI